MARDSDRQGNGPVRLDKWLWAARFYKMRGLARDAVEGGKVHLNGERAKPAKSVQPGDEIRIRKGWQEWTVVVKALSDRRGPAAAAQGLYEETPASLKLREDAIEQRRLYNQGKPLIKGRPTKRERRQMRHFLKGW